MWPCAHLPFMTEFCFRLDKDSPVRFKPLKNKLNRLLIISSATETCKPLIQDLNFFKKNITDAIRKIWCIQSFLIRFYSLFFRHVVMIAVRALECCGAQIYITTRSVLLYTLHHNSQICIDHRERQAYDVRTIMKKGEPKYVRKKIFGGLPFTIFIWT